VGNTFLNSLRFGGPANHDTIDPFVRRIGQRRGSNKPNTLSKRDSKTTVQVTHPAHPLKGQVLAILPMVGGKPDANQVLVALPDGEQQLIPTEWTDLGLGLFRQQFVAMV